MNSNLSNSTSPISLSDSTSPVFILVWFEIIAACITYGLGFIGNLLSLIIFFSQEEFRNVSTGVLFLLMTISNTIHLWTLTTEFLGTFNNVSRTVSTYLAIGTTIDRYIRSQLPIRSRRICTRRNAIKFTLICLLVSSILCSFWFCPLNTLNPLTNTCYTGQSLTYTYFINNIFLPIRLIVVCIIPVIIMSIANIRMLYNIRQSRRRVQQGTQTNATAATTNALIIFRRMTPLDRMLFYMMLASVGTFIITQIPFHIYTLVQAKYLIYDLWNNLLIRALLLIWSSVYFGIGFYLYCLASPLFREKFFLLRQKLMNCIRGQRPI